jgi:hypothetical protein
MRIKADILSGEYLPTHQAIAFDTKGNLQDGQHRICSIATAGVSVISWVQFNQPCEYFKVLDSGTARLVSDNLHHAGIARSQIVAPGLKNVILYNRYPDRTWTNLPMPTPSEILNLYNQNTAWHDEISLACLEANKKYKPLNKSSLFAACFLIATCGHSCSQVIGFCDYLADGTNLHETSPILAYRNFLVNSTKPAKSSNLQQFSLNCFIKVWNYSLTNQQLKQFKAPGYPPMQKIIPASSFASPLIDDF